MPVILLDDTNKSNIEYHLHAHKCKKEASYIIFLEGTLPEQMGYIHNMNNILCTTLNAPEKHTFKQVFKR